LQFADLSATAERVNEDRDQVAAPALLATATVDTRDVARIVRDPAAGRRRIMSNL
jgi:hypothetical protein